MGWLPDSPLVTNGRLFMVKIPAGIRLSGCGLHECDLTDVRWDHLDDCALYDCTTPLAHTGRPNDTTMSVTAPGGRWLRIVGQTPERSSPWMWTPHHDRISGDLETNIGPGIAAVRSAR